MYPLLQMGKLKVWRIKCQKFLEWSFTNRAEEQDTGELDVKSCSAADLLSHLNWPSWASKECVWTVHMGWVKFKFQWSLSTSSSLEKNPPLFKNNQKTPSHIMYVTNTSVFSPSVWYSLNQQVFGGEGKYLCRTVTLQSLRSSLCLLPSLKVGGCHVGESVTPGHRPDS